MKIEVESPPPQRDFYELRRELIEQGKKFDDVSLTTLPYSHLHLCCIGNAESAACLPRLVQQEKMNRRERFLNMEADEFKAAETYLKLEQMYDDVVYAIAVRNAPKWGHLTDRQRIWLKLTCLCNHIDDPLLRMGQVTKLYTRCGQNPESGLPADFCSVYAGKLKGLASVCGKLSPETLRGKLWEIGEMLWEFIPAAEQQLLESEQLQDYSCTSDCFRVVV